MNQSIIFPDTQIWKNASQVVSFPAQQSGALIECLAPVNLLEKLYGKDIDGEKEALTAFEALRFDLEDMAEEKIEAEEFNPLGQIELN